MKSACCLFALLVFLLSCANHAALRLPPLEAGPEKIDCEVIYPQGKWQFVHSLEFSLADGKKGSAIGVSVIDDPLMECALMTVEGFVLFAARYDGELEIKRAVPPFDNEEFAAGLVRDLRLLFFRPRAAAVQYGKSGDGSLLCRYPAADGQGVDIVLAPEQWRIDQYGPDQLRRRRITAGSSRESRQWRPPEYLELKADGFSEYTIKMTLLSAERIR